MTTISNLPPEARSVAYARRLTRATLAGWGVTPETIDDATLVVSELVTNAVTHARPPITLSLTRKPGGLRAEITDHGALAPLVPRRAGEAATGGRGLGLVDELADRWNVEVNGERGCKTVWFEMEAGLTCAHAILAV
ncbi:anti-sigma regulatory factor (Ser/Thr protein kinase) [Nonomuraea thailandensis]|uniref:Anti-sigma regulatory factor (Ser/Thr protein kinase) n=1 Tax=Nonomuraea thailandensis TaxID=1188745 RepID=A0A9X2GAZ5_9ACTN|nr:ATP-binding protein [Nonomuraea thailandensis]MCP2355874.1 anti-sigma regulatory factor (Ser/Thr protein kinase) [Nonomuraea thailandensis]